MLATESSKCHTTPGGTQPSHDIVGLALVLLDLEKSGMPTPCNYLLCRSVSSSTRAARLGIFDQIRGGKLECIRLGFRVLVFSDDERIPA